MSEKEHLRNSESEILKTTSVRRIDPHTSSVSRHVLDVFEYKQGVVIINDEIQ